jgi:hypothetical protein
MHEFEDIAASEESSTPNFVCHCGAALDHSDHSLCGECRLLAKYVDLGGEA